ALLQTSIELCNRLRLITRRRKGLVQVKNHSSVDHVAEAQKENKRPSIVLGCSAKIKLHSLRRCC
ncbi:MAG: hypothetical protein ACMV0H_02500, partial [Aquaspirillum sp.]